MSLARRLAFLALALLPSLAVADGLFIPAPGRTDMVHDSDRNLLYITSGGEVLVFDLTTQQFSSSYFLGGNLRGIDLLPGSTWLAVADESSSPTEVWIWFVHLRAQTAEKIAFPKHPAETGTWSVAFADTDNRLLITSTSDGSGPVPIREFNRSWWTTVELPLVPDSGVGGKTMVAASGDGETAGWAEGGSADGPYGRYVTATGALAETAAGAGTGTSNYEIGVNADGSQLAIPTAQGCRITDSALNVVTTIGTSGGPRPIGVVYHPVEPIVYFSWATSGEVRAYDTQTFAQIATYDAETTFSDPNGAAFGSGRARISRDGSLLFVTVAGGVRYFQLYSSLAADAVTASTVEETPVPVTLEGSIGNGAALSYAIYASCNYEPAVTGTPPNVIFTPCVDAFGEGGFQYDVTYGRVTKTGEVNVWIEPVNDPPTVSDSAVETMEDEPILYLCLDVWDHYEYDSTITITTQPLHGTLSGDPFCPRYEPDFSYFGVDSFRFVATDADFQSAAATVSITVTPVNDPPWANSQSLSTPEDSPVAILLSGADIEGSSLSFEISAAPTRGALSGIPPNVVYTPSPNFAGVDSFFFTVSDGQTTSATAEVRITVSPVNDVPTATAQTVTTAEDTPTPILLAGADPDGTPLTFAISSPPSHGTLSGTPPNLTFTPFANYGAADSFGFEVSDGVATSAPAVVSITITPMNDAPVADAKSIATAEDTPLAIVLTGSDVEGSALSFAIASGPAHGTLSGNGANRTYSPSANYSGPDSLTYTAGDDQATSAPATVSISVASVNDLPNAVNDAATTRKNTAVTILVLANDSDADGDALTVISTTVPTKGGSVAILSGGTSVRFTPKSTFTGTDTFSYTVSDGRGGTRSATVTVTVTR